MQTIVTIGTCVRNSEATIKDTIESIVHQKFPHELMEVILVDDGSEDNTLSIIRERAPEIGIRTRIFHTEWKGLGYVRNIVVREASGKYILWVDGDMTLSDDYVKNMVEFMERNLGVGIAKGKYELTPGDNWVSTLEIYSRAALKMVDFNVKVRSRSLGTGGSIHRVKAIREIGGFDENIKGYGEDWDAEYKIRVRGWLLQTVDVSFRDYERYGLSWKQLWNRYIRRGYDMFHFLKRNKGMIDLYKMLPPGALLAGLLHSLILYQLTSRKTVFLMPILYVFKMTAWCIGFTKAYLRHVSF